jgi:hypothetical protein
MNTFEWFLSLTDAQRKRYMRMAKFLVRYHMACCHEEAIAMIAQRLNVEQRIRHIS